MVEHWLGLAHTDLTEHVRRAVRGGSAATAPWSEVAAHPVLAARVRGILSVIQSQMADHRDHAMWTLWINAARRALNTAPPQAPAPVKTRPARPAAPAPVEEIPEITLATAPPPRSQRHVVPPVTFLAAGQIPASSTE
ncbi:hypothetical protein JOF56_007044 [Kibdelosporangium banguiense]|uniref:Uncharacterized protein n=1 Tax=Kibdelosporangium banguiense TaxID=1365924 RepID=A0ABS4TQG8_9PSEU|nr:hypothetical protein [Kibdelosporangium banguiense]MBP2326659.1 hypothetical protein [Kibdelosporangium banguiense]